MIQRSTGYWCCSLSGRTNFEIIDRSQLHSRHVNQNKQNSGRQKHARFKVNKSVYVTMLNYVACLADCHIVMKVVNGRQASCGDPPFPTPLRRELVGFAKQSKVGRRAVEPLTLLPSVPRFHRLLVALTDSVSETVCRLPRLLLFLRYQKAIAHPFFMVSFVS